MTATYRYTLAAALTAISMTAGCEPAAPPPATQSPAPAAHMLMARPVVVTEESAAQVKVAQSVDG